MKFMIALFAFLSCFLLIGIESPSANSNSNLYWIANSKIPTEEQMSRLINMETTASDQIDTSQIDYSKVGEYPIFIHRANNVVEELTFSIRQHSPIESTIPETIQVEANQQMDLHQIVQSEMPKKYARIPFEFSIPPKQLKNVHEEMIEGQWTDFYGRQFRKTMKLQVVDQTAPILSIVNDQINVQKNEYVDAEKIIKLAGIAVYDAVDSSIEPEFQFRNLTTETIGQYEIIVQAKDRSGNQSIQHYVVVNVGGQRTIQHEVGKQITEARFLHELGLTDVDWIDWSSVYLDQVGNYKIPMKLRNGQEITVNFEVIDRTAPIVELGNPVDQQLSKGEHKNTLIATDRYGNRAYIPFTIKIISGSMVVSVKNNETPPSKPFKRKLIRSENNITKVETVLLPAHEEKLSNIIDQKPPNFVIALIAAVGSVIFLFLIITIFNRWKRFFIH